MLQRTVLYDEHVKLGAKIVPFAGWEMPVQYGGVIQEHEIVRTGVGVFDIGHMGIIALEGADALGFIQKMTTNDASKLRVNQIQYSLLCNAAGGVIDDILVYRLFDRFILVVNASNAQKVLYWLEKNKKGDLTITSWNKTRSMLAIQGPKSEEVLSRIASVELDSLKYYNCIEGAILGKKCLISRTGYTGEDGFELILNQTEVKIIWKYFMENKITPCGLAARDTLRLEAGMPLYGQELGEEMDPMALHLNWAINMDKDFFVGKEALQKKETIETIAGIEMLDKAIPRHGYVIQEGGLVTSGTYSPTLKKPIGIVLINKELAKIGNTVQIVIRDKLHPARIVQIPFYKRKKQEVVQ